MLGLTLTQPNEVKFDLCKIGYRHIAVSRCTSLTIKPSAKVVELEIECEGVLAVIDSCGFDVGLSAC